MHLYTCYLFENAEVKTQLYRQPGDDCSSNHQGMSGTFCHQVGTEIRKTYIHLLLTHL